MTRLLEVMKELWVDETWGVDGFGGLAGVIVLAPLWIAWGLFGVVGVMGFWVVCLWEAMKEKGRGSG